MIYCCGPATKLLFLHGVSLVRPAPAELPQDRKVARVGGCSGAMQVAYPLFYTNYRKFRRIITNCISIRSL